MKNCEEMSEASSNSNLPYDVSRAVSDLKDKFKHGHHIIKILESQLDTATQNISLLQGQVRLANETIDNLKRQFNQADLILSYMTENKKERNVETFKTPVDGYRQGNAFAQIKEEYESQRKGSGVERCSPKAMQRSNQEGQHEQMELEAAERPKSPSCQGKLSYGPDRPKSPYEQQLRQVLDALDEDPRRMSTSLAHDRDASSVSQSQSQMCMCAECVPQHSSSSAGTSSHRHYQDTSSRAHEYGCSEMHYHGECSKHDFKATGPHEDMQANSQISRSREDSSRHFVSPAHGSRSMDYSSRCNDPCCTDPSKGYKIVDTSHGMSPYISSRSTKHRHQHHHDASGKMIGHCDDKCHCHAFVNYAPFGYQVVESAPGIPQAIQPITPSLTAAKKNKRYLPVAPGDEPPHLKYTKVKRIDGSKVAAQKTIQDFSKRRFHPYNPKWDLDLLIVPPPIPAMDLLSVLGADPNCSYEIEKESVSSSTSVDTHDQLEASTASTDGYDSSSIKSKVINSGGTVIVLTEGDNVDPTRSVLHSTPKVYPVETTLDCSRSSSDTQTSFDDTSRLQKDVGRFRYDFNSKVSNGRKSSEDDRRHQIDARNSPADAATIQSIPGILDPTTQHVASESFVGHSKSSTASGQQEGFNGSLSYNNATDDSVFKIPESVQNTSVITAASIKKERNNNSFSNNAISLMLQHQQHKQTDRNEAHTDTSSNLTARYEQVLFQRNQDFSKLGTNDEYIIQNRIKGKVH